MKTITKQSKGFTLVELIVVITILAILATVGFLSLQGYTDDAKTTKTQANLRTVASSLVNDQAITSNSFAAYLKKDDTLKIATAGTATAFSGVTLNLAGTTDAYAVGEVVPATLRLDGTKFFDTNSGGTLKPFLMGAITVTDKSTGKNRLRPVFQVAGTVKSGGVSSAVVEGNFATGSVATTGNTADVWGLIKSINVTTTIGGTASGSNVAPVFQGSSTNLPYAL